MAENAFFDPFEVYKKMSLDFEKNMNDMIHKWSDNEAAFEFSKVLTGEQLKKFEHFKDLQLRVLSELNLPTKKDVESISSLVLQGEEKIDTVEEQVWEMTDTVKMVNDEVKELLASMKDIVKVKKQLKSEVTKLKTELKEQKENSEIEELKNEVASLKEIILNNAKQENSLETEGFRQEIKDINEQLSVFLEREDVKKESKDKQLEASKK